MQTMITLRYFWLFVTPWTVVRQAPLSLGFSRQEYCSGLPFPSPGDLPHPGIEPASPELPALAGRFFFQIEPPGKIILRRWFSIIKRISVLFFIYLTKQSLYLITLNFQFFKNALSSDVTFLPLGITENKYLLSSSCEVTDSLEVLFKLFRSWLPSGLAFTYHTSPSSVVLDQKPGRQRRFELTEGSRARGFSSRSPYLDLKEL